MRPATDAIDSRHARAETAPARRRAASGRRVATIARNTFREAVRDRVLYNLVLFVVLLTVASVFLGAASAAQDTKIIVDLGLSASLLFGVFIAVFVGVGLVYKEIERRTLYAIFSKPVGRGEFLLGKYLGLCLTLAINVAVMGLAVSLAVLYATGGQTSLAVRLWPAVALIYMELAILTGVALLFSSFSSPILSAFATFAVFVIGHFSGDLKDFAAVLDARAATATFTTLYYLLPNLSNFAYITPAAYGLVPPASHLASALAYTVVYVAVLLAGATLIFRHRDFK